MAKKIIDLVTVEADYISTKTFIVSIILVILVFSILLVLKENYNKWFIPLFITLITFMLIFIGRLIRWFEPDIGSSIQHISSVVLIFDLFACYFIYTISFIPIILGKLAAVSLGIAIVMQLLEMITVRNIFLLLIILFWIIEMIIIFLKK